jgi:hypothetical protein
VAGRARRLPILRYGDDAVAPERLDRQVRWLKDRGYRAVTFSQLHSHALPPKPVLITLDGGGESLLGPLRVLSDAGFAACVFVAAGLAGTERAGRPLLGWDGLREVAARGFEIGAHSLTRASLRGLSSAELEREITGGKKELESRLGLAVRAFAWPDGVGVDEPGQRAMVSAAGYDFACRNEGGSERLPAPDPMALRRIPVADGPLIGFAWRLL